MVVGSIDKPKKLKAIIFDLDGTLLDTLEDLKNATNAALEYSNMPIRTLDEVRRFVGNGVRKLMERAVPNGCDNPKFEETYTYFREYYEKHCKENTKAYDGIYDLFEELKKQGYEIAIVSNKMDEAVKILNKDYFSEYVSVAIGENVKVAKKPAPDTVNKALEELNFSNEEAIYVGDSEVDIQTAQNAKMPCVSVKWGFRDEKFLRENGGKCFIDKPSDLLEAIA
ncbi:HAD family hydrolase [Lachnobacterium bovis]|uniref:Phosphoglycolate phosphatase n=1 Tax=Lachnobacterium bovis DSM 14045 TaxID=1122142 RepID=A0A1H3MKD7_9FIRM|nr:HAD-IIIA family hydrolase [Lachnobacterium bovis]MBQ1802034.1 HAD-IIIA family hydrolase [Lachnobacterium sp.]SDY77131.1 phosphoglycolate phosphatase [Lachnobacterium bovis DSM 14045]